MSLVTVVWVSKDNNTFRSYCLARRLVVGSGLALLLLALTSLAGLGWAGKVSLERALLRSDREELAAQLAEADTRLRQQEARSQTLLEDNRRISEAFREIRATDNKIRRYLGLTEKTYDAIRSHQGGMGTSGAFEDPIRDNPAAGSDRAVTSSGSGDVSEIIRSSLEEVLVFLEGRRQESSRLPTILPAASDKVWLSCEYGWREDPFAANRREFHNGIDIAGPWKTPVLSPADGGVIEVGRDRLFGVYVKLKHSEKVRTLYGHLDSAAVRKGARVNRGQVIGYMGNTGRSTGTHLHYSVAVDDKYVDPQEFIWDRPFKTLVL